MKSRNSNLLNVIKFCLFYVSIVFVYLNEEIVQQILNPNNYYDGNNKIKKLNNIAIKSSILYSLIKDCLEKNPEERLSIEQISQKYTPLIQTIH